MRMSREEARSSLDEKNNDSEVNLKKKERYRRDMPREMYTFFIGYSESGSLPSFSKFARSIGRTLEELYSYRKHSEFDRAYRECNEIRRDYLIDAALTRRYDSSFSKFLLSAEYGMGEKEKEKEDGELNVTLEVVANGGCEA